MSGQKRISWHPGFYGGMEFDLRKYLDGLVFEQEHELSKEPLRMDLLIIKKKDGLEIENDMCRIFRQHNILEYKSPKDELSIDDLYKTVGYACIYKSFGKRVNEMPADTVTVSVVRHRFPRNLFSELKKLGVAVEKKYDGVYYIKGLINLPLQIVVVSEITDEACVALKVLTPGERENEVKRFVNEATGSDLPGDRRNADAVLQVSVTANKDLYSRIMEEKKMCEALEELMKDKLDEREKRGREEGLEMGREEGLAQGAKERSLLEKEIARLKNELNQVKAATG